MVSRRIVLFWALVFVVLICTTIVSAQAPSSQSTVTGTFTVNGKTVQLKYVYAIIMPDMFQTEKDALFAVLSAVPAADDQLRDPFRLFNPSKAGTQPATAVTFYGYAQP